MHTIQRRTLAARSTATLAVVVALGLSGCGDDDSANSAADSVPTAAPTTAEFCGAMQQFDNGDDSGPFTEFYDRHPEPTPADWAHDGHLVTEALQDAIDTFGSVRPSTEAAPLMTDVLDAFEVIKQNSLDVIKAGEDDDQSAIDDLEAVNQDINVPTLMTAIDEVAHLCEESGAP